MKKLLQYDVGETVELFLFIKRATKATASNGKPYLTLVLHDKSGELEARVWDANEMVMQTLIPGEIVFISGEIQSYKNKKQLKLRSIRLKLPEEKIEAFDLIPTSPMAKDELVKCMNEALSEMTNPNVKRIVSHILQKHKKDFLEFPAATKNHHEFFGGLAYHVVSMLKIGRALVAIYPTLNRDLLYGGIVLHDLGKVIELSGAIATTYTTVGNLLGHITIMVNEIAQAANELGIDSEDTQLLQHMVLSHHGKLEWGSPKAPMLREAEMLHFIDNIDARMNMIDQALENVAPGQFTERVFALEGRSFYKPQ